MSNKIVELAIQSSVTGYFAADTECATPIPLPPELQKFAELIVKECISLFDGSREIKTVGMLSCRQIVEQINEHFGVK